MADVLSRLRASKNPAAGSTGCSLVYVQDDAIFCVAGAVCGERTLGQVCPTRGDESVSGCSSHMKSYDPITKRCVAPSQAKCEKLVTGDWGCVFPKTMSAVPSSSSSSSSSSSHTNAVYDSTPTTYRLEHPHSELSLVGWNSIIVVAILMSMVVVGFAIMCKRRRDWLTPRRTIQRSPGAISDVEILTPL